MQLQTISEVSKLYGISTRTLRYYEQIGLIKPSKKDDFAYRVYDAETVMRLRQIIVLRKLRIPLKQIAEILVKADTRMAIEAFERSLAEIDDEITALATIRSVTRMFIARLSNGGEKFALPDDDSLLEVVDALSLSKINFKEERSMSDLNQASEKLTKLTDVRIIHLPPMTIAAASAIGENCEGRSGEMLNNFVRENNLLTVKPDLRFFGFDCSAGQTGVGQSSHKYQSWVSIPDDMDVPEPLIKRKFTGGLYAAHMIAMGNFDHWALLADWVNTSEKYANDWNNVRVSPIEPDMDRCLEEMLNYNGRMQNPEAYGEDIQFDLLFPVRLR
jgi:DNA-binding transcriptional MerR regulator/DNA gyrase inhibitor GyrI